MYITETGCADSRDEVRPEMIRTYMAQVPFYDLGFRIQPNHDTSERVLRYGDIALLLCFGVPVSNELHHASHKHGVSLLIEGYVLKGRQSGTDVCRQRSQLPFCKCVQM